MKEAKHLMEEQLTETVVKVQEVEDSINLLEKAITSKQGPLATCQLRIQQRKQRPNYELVLDDVDIQLQTEAQNLIDRWATSRCAASLNPLIVAHVCVYLQSSASTGWRRN